MVRHDIKIDVNELWKKLPWKKFRVTLFRLQRRIYQAVRNGDLARARNLQKLVLKSAAARMLAIRQITQLNRGKQTAGVDGVKSLDILERFKTFFCLGNIKNWKPSELRRIPIPKKNGKMRILSVPTIYDRIWQCIVKYALEPAHEATFHANSYGFRPGRGAHDAQKLVYLRLSSNVRGYEKRVIELDIKKCFDTISHSAIMDRLIAGNEMKAAVFRSLKAGAFPGFPDEGTPQGGVFSPLLANIALNGIEELHTCVRYADDMLFFLKPKDNADKILSKVENFLAERGMHISMEKTKVTPATQGFDFLGWHCKVQKNKKYRCTPSTDNYKAFMLKVKTIITNSNMSPEEKVKQLAPIVRGWRQYHKYCKMDGSRFSLWNTHRSFFYRLTKLKSIGKNKGIELCKKAFPAVAYSENKFINVKGDSSPYNGNLTYWSERNSKLYTGYTVSLLKEQNHTCPVCGTILMHDENIELHHLDGNHNNWRRSNVSVMHKSCHQYLHMRHKGL